MSRLESNPIMIKERASMVWLPCGSVEVMDGAFVLVDKDGVRIQVPVGGLACVFLEPGTRITHEAVALAAEAGCLLVWVGEGGTRVYSSGQPGGARADRLLYQARLALEDEPRLRVVRAMYKMRFGEEPPAKRSVQQLRGIEGVRVRTLYQELAKQYGLTWKRRDYSRDDFDAGDDANRCLSVANHCLYGICEAAILAAGYAPAIGFIHTGKPLSFVYDIADLFKFTVSVPIAFKVATYNAVADKARETRLYCRNSFRKHRLLERIIPAIEEVLSAGGLPLPEAHPEAVPMAIPNEEATGDAGHRN
jgi:CRISPR-associated protein Cas1